MVSVTNDGDNNDAITPFRREVSSRFGVLPNFFCSAASAPGLIEELWGFAKSAYLDSPLPSLFKERLFVHLSRFCEIRYCIVRHVGFLIGHGRPAGDADAVAETIDQVIALLSLPIPSAEVLADAFSRLSAQHEPMPIPEPRTQAETDLFAALSVIFLEPGRSERARDSVRSAVGETMFEILTAYLAFIRTAHYWTETHPELAYEPDMLEVMVEREDLKLLLLDPSDAERVKTKQDLRRVLDELHQTEAALRESESRFRALVTATSYVIYRMSPDWQEMRQLEGAGFLRDAPQPSIRWLDVYIDPADRPQVMAAIRHAIKRKETFKLEHRVRRADGSFGWTLSRAVPIIDRRGEIVEWFGAASDITDRREAEARLRELTDTLESRVAERTRELRDAEAALRQSQKMDAVGQLTGGVAHDFNNLLTIIRSSVDFLRRPNLSEERRRRYTDAISDTVDRASKLTGQLLAFARRQVLKPEIVDLAALLQSVAEMISTVTGARIKVMSDLPNQPCFVKVDVNQFETSLINMAVNARDAMGGEGTLTMKLTCGESMPPIRGHARQFGRFIKLELSDTGTGISETNLERIFEPFFTTKETGKGTGLGLSQVFGFAKQSGGDVDVVSELGRGTTFTLYLPEVDAEPETTGDQGDHGLAPGGAGGRVLIVEDDIQVGQFAKQILEDLGYVPTLVTDAEAALDALGDKGNAFDAVFSDVVMPGMGGMALAKILRERFPGLQIILTSGYSDVLAQDGNHGFRLLHKPYSADQLSRILGSAVMTNR